MEAVRNYPWEHRIKRNIRKYLPEDEVELTIIHNNNLDVYIKTKSTRITILSGSTFTKCKEYIDKCLEERKKNLLNVVYAWKNTINLVVVQCVKTAGALTVTSR